MGKLPEVCVELGCISIEEHAPDCPHHPKPIIGKHEPIPAELVAEPVRKKRDWPKISIEIGGIPPTRCKYDFRPWFFLEWFPGDDSSRRQFSLFLPFFKLRIYP